MGILNFKVPMLDCFPLIHSLDWNPTDTFKNELPYKK
jgi:hypothetical protein